MTWLHIITGLVALVSGAVALFAIKGGTIHRKSGMLFVYTMLAMSASGAVMAALQPIRVSVIAGGLAFYLVCTALVTVRRSSDTLKWLTIFFMCIAYGLAALAFNWAHEATKTAKQALDGFPAPIYMAFGSVALIAALLDTRLVVAGRIEGKHRLARHLWRMCSAMYLATSAFFLGQAKLLPLHLQNFVVLSVPVIAVLLMMLYWLLRVLLFKHPLRIPERAGAALKSSNVRATVR
jgi:hypothetical protein